MGTTLVAGAQWGDEGKGKVVDLLAPKSRIVARYQGGANAGHTIVSGDRRTVLHQLPSGVLSPGVKNAIGNGCVVDVLALIEEMEVAKAAGVELRPERLTISSTAHVVTEIHQRVDRARGKAIGTTGRGIGPCYTDKVRRTGLRVESLIDGTLAERFAHHLGAWREDLEALDLVADVDPERTLEQLARAGETLRPYIGDVAELLAGIVEDGGDILLEGAQGALLDVDHGTYPFVTSSTTTIGGAYSGVGIYLEIARRIGVVKAYTTRVGEGPFPTELHGDQGRLLQREGGEVGATTGRPRRCGWLDIPLLRKACRLNGFNEIVLTKLDVLSTLDEIPVAVDRDAEGKLVFRSFPGWGAPIAKCRSWSELPSAARDYVRAVQDLVGVPVSAISLGPDRAQMVFSDSWDSSAS